MEGNSANLDTLTIPGMTPGDAARELSTGLQADLGMTYDAARIGHRHTPAL